MEYSTVLELSRLYARQERYELQSTAVGQILYAELFRGGVEGVLENYANLRRSSAPSRTGRRSCSSATTRCWPHWPSPKVDERPSLGALPAGGRR